MEKIKNTIKVTTYKYEKIPVKDTEIFVPNKPFYCFQTGVRRSIKIIPKFIEFDPHPFSSMKKGDIYELEVTSVYNSFECKITKTKVQISSFEDILNTESKSSYLEIPHMLMNEDYVIRSKEQFEKDFENALERIMD